MINVIDTPGDPKYEKNKFTNLALGEIAVICVSADPEKYESVFRGPHSIKDELLICKSYNIGHIVFVTTFMDKVKFSENIFVTMVE